MNPSSKTTRRENPIVKGERLVAALVLLLATAPDAWPHQGDGSDPSLVHACVRLSSLSPGVWRKVKIVGPEGVCKVQDVPVHWSIGPSLPLPIGGLVAYAGVSAPNDSYLLCDGSAVSRTTYAALFAVIGTSYGGGDGSTTFNLPDLRARVPIGRGVRADVDALGESEGLPVDGRTPRHKHGKGSIAIPSGGVHGHGLRLHSIPDPYTGAMWQGGQGSYIEPAGNMVTPSAHAHPNTEFTGEVGNVSGPLDTAPYVVTNYLIRAL